MHCDSKYLSDCTESGMLMFKEGVEEFYKCFMDKINQLMASSGRDVNVCFVHLIFLCLNEVESYQEIVVNYRRKLR